jgi:hypothetical protein
MQSSGESRREMAESRSLVSLAPPLRGEGGVRGSLHGPCARRQPPTPEIRCANFDLSPQAWGEVTRRCALGCLKTRAIRPVVVAREGGRSIIPAKAQ